MRTDFISYQMGAISNQGDNNSQVNDFFTLLEPETVTSITMLDRSFQDEEEEEDWEDEEEWDEEEEDEEDWEDEEEEEDWEDEEEWEEEEEE